jgi:hypothetical protein
VNRSQLGEHRIARYTLSLHGKDSIERHRAIEEFGDIVGGTGLLDFGKLAGKRLGLQDSLIDAAG